MVSFLFSPLASSTKSSSMPEYEEIEPVSYTHLRAHET